MKGKVAFIVPGDNRSGGVRVTATMAEMLRRRGWGVRIAHPNPKHDGISLMRTARNRMLARFYGVENRGWLRDFGGPIEAYRNNPQEIGIDPGEVLIGVGTFGLTELRRVPETVIKVRYCHGIPDVMTDRELACWRTEMPTLAVAATLIPKMRGLGVRGEIEVVPNGVDFGAYFAEGDSERNAIGAMYSEHPAKGPEVMIAVLERLGEAVSSVQREVFSTDRQPRRLKGCGYTRYPTVEGARKIYNRCAVWLVTSEREGLPGAVLEAMACGCVVVSSDNVGSREIIQDGVNGILVSGREAERYVKKVCELVKDRERLGVMRKEALKRSSEFGWESAASRMERFLETLAVAESVCGGTGGWKAKSQRVSSTTG